MTYNTIVQRIRKNLGLTALTQQELDDIKLDIVDIITLVTREAESLKAVATITATDDGTTEQSQDLSASPFSNFYMPLEVVFFSSSGNKYISKEIEHEEYLKWNPNASAETATFSEIASDSDPDELTYTIENEQLDGYVCYTIKDTFPMTMSWKPRIAGTIQVLYLQVGVSESITSPETSKPSLHEAFHNVIIDGVMVRQLQAKITKVDNEVQLYALNGLLKNYKDSFDKGLAKFSGYINKRVETARIEPFDFLNDRTMLL